MYSGPVDGRDAWRVKGLNLVYYDVHRGSSSLPAFLLKHIMEVIAHLNGVPAES